MCLLHKIKSSLYDCPTSSVFVKPLFSHIIVLTTYPIKPKHYETI